VNLGRKRINLPVLTEVVVVLWAAILCEIVDMHHQWNFAFGENLHQVRK
jgi:hypothetical protein